MPAKIGKGRMDMVLKVLLESKETLREALKQYWTEQTRKEIEARVKKIDRAIDRLCRRQLVAG